MIILMSNSRQWYVNSKPSRVVKYVLLTQTPLFFDDDDAFCL